GQLDLAWARRASLEGEAALAEDHLASARRRLREAKDGGSAGRPLIDRSFDVRFAARGLERAISSFAAPARRAKIPDLPKEALAVARQGRYFRPPEGDFVDLSRRRSLARLVARLAKQRHLSPGQGLPWQALFESGWPKESLPAEAAKNRLLNAI